MDVLPRLPSIVPCIQVLVYFRMMVESFQICPQPHVLSQVPKEGSGGPNGREFKNKKEARPGDCVWKASIHSSLLSLQGQEELRRALAAFRIPSSGQEPEMLPSRSLV